MPAHRIQLIVNPNADMGNAWRQASDLRPVVDAFGGADWSGTVYPTHATELARQAAEAGYELVIAAGGDGTVHEVVNGLMQVPRERRPRLGVVPLGSGNDFAHAAGITEHDPAQALRQVLQGTPRRLDIGRVEDEHGRVEFFDNTLGIGFDATVTIRSHKLPVVRGFLMYLIAVLQTIMMDNIAPRLRFTSDREHWEAARLMLVICNGPREGGGFLVAPDAVPDDGLFHYACIDQVSRLQMLRTVPEVMRGTHGRLPYVHMGTLQHLELHSDRPLAIHLDGEIFAGPGSSVQYLKLDVLPQELEVQV